MRYARNDLCWCGSKKKYKHCHMAEDSKPDSYMSLGHPVPSVKLIKSSEQIEHIKKSAAITKKILNDLKFLVKAGITTGEIDQFVYDTTIEKGGVPATLGYEGYKKSCCTSINNVVCHGIPDDRVLKQGDIINVDITTDLNGYFADASKMYKIGPISEEADRLVSRSEEAMYLGIEKIRPFEPVNVIGDGIEPFAALHGYSIVRALGGHGTGLEFHEKPHVNHFHTEEKGMILVPGMVLTVEPMVNQGTYHVRVLKDHWTVVTRDDKLSAQWEHTVLVTDHGAEILT